MFVARVSFAIQPSEAPAFEKAAVLVSETMLSMPGCSIAKFYREVGNDGGVTLYQEWRSLEDSQAYLNSPAFAENGTRLRPFIASPPKTVRFSASPIET